MILITLMKRPPTKSKDVKGSNKKAVSVGIYDPARIESKWQKKWAKSKIYSSDKPHPNPLLKKERGNASANKFYVLDMFPYPSGEGLHVGHPKGYIATDIVSRFQRMNGKNILHPMGFDAFGLPAENYALKTKTNPADSVKKNVARYKKQLEIMGFDYDWSREINTTDPKYYKWTQWIFLQMFKKGLAYESFEPINWCPSCKTGLANEDVENGRCERCGTPVEKKPMRQWVLKITDYADRLLKDLDLPADSSAGRDKNLEFRILNLEEHKEGGFDPNKIPHVIDKKNPPKEGKVTQPPRRTIHALVRDPKTGKFLGLKWFKYPWITFIVGGVEAGEDFVDAAKREVLEETGYSDIKFVQFLGGPVKAEYFAAHKDVNRVAITTAILFELVSDKQTTIADEEKKEHEAIWMDTKDMTEEVMTCAELPFWLERLPSATIEMNNGVPCFTQIVEPGTVRKDLPFVERNAIAAIVKHWSEDKYIGLKWKKVAWQTLITGGIEKGQTAEEAARMEIQEETGYKNLKFVKHLGKVESKFFHVPKNENRHAHFDVLYFELQNDEKEEISDKEKSNHEVVWVEKDKMEGFVGAMGQKYMWSGLFLGQPFEGVSEVAPQGATSLLLDWPESIKEAQRNWIGRSEGAEIDFRLKFANNKTRFVIIHGYKGSAKTNFIPWLKSELEKMGHEVEVPELPDSVNPTEAAQVGHVLKNCHFDENTVVIGHSLGAVVAMKAVMKLNKPISGLVIVAAAQDPKFFKGRINPNHYSKDFKWDFDYALIRKLTDGKIAVLSDTQEYRVNNRNEFLKYLAEQLSARFVEVTSNQEHFVAEKEPEILKAVTPSVNVFTTRPDTIFGVTYLVLAPEHKLVSELLNVVENNKEVEGYINRAINETEIERTDAKKDKTGVELKGVKAVNPANGEEVPVWIADYVLPDYGTGAVMAVPAHDERDWEFAKKFALRIKYVVAPLITRKGDEDAWRPNEKEIVRPVVACIIKHWSEDKYLFLRKKLVDKAVVAVAGGIDGEDIIEAGQREIREETGYLNARFIRDLGLPNFYRFYSVVHNQNRISELKPLYFELINGDREEVSEDEKRQHESIWLTEGEIDTYLKGRPFNQMIWNQYKGIENPIVNHGILINSDKFNGKDSEYVKKEITSFVGGSWVIKYKLRDWVFSRQRYWGEPIPIIHCPKCALRDPSGRGAVAVPEKDLPVKLPRVKYYEPTGTGESPLAAIKAWVNVKCPQCKGPAKRETNTMPQWAGSSWYYLRYEDPKNNKVLVDPKKEKYWSPVDLYVGGAEHATRHLIYARFWHKFLYDIGVVSKTEPFIKLQNVGLIMGEDGKKMSKRFGNVINPDDIVKTFGADTLRIYEMFMGPFDQQIAWSTTSIVGARRFIERVWKLSSRFDSARAENVATVASAAGHSAPITRILHRTVKKVTEDIRNLRFNTAISSLMIVTNELEKEQMVSREQFEVLLKLLAPFAPHFTEELWTVMGNKQSIHISEWPQYNPAMLLEDEVVIMVQVNGKVRGSFKAQKNDSDEALKAAALALPEVKKWTDGKEVKKVIVVKGRLVSIVL